MTDTTHTPGPWRVLHKTGVFPMDSDCWTIGTAEQHRKEHVANARLMAAAPDLLAAAVALEEAETVNANCLECDGEWVPEACPVCFPHFDKARLLRRAAIARATGAAS